MGIEAINSSSNNGTTTEVKIKVNPNDYYEFFNYKDSTSWGNDEELMNRHLENAKYYDTHKFDKYKTCVQEKDGYLNLNEYKNFYCALDTKEKEKFPKPEITEEAKKTHKKDLFCPRSIRESTAVTDKEKKNLEFLNRATCTSIFIGLGGAAGMAISGATGLKDKCFRGMKTGKSGIKGIIKILRKGNSQSRNFLYGRCFSGGSLLAVAIGVAIGVTLCIASNIYQKKLTEKAKAAENQNNVNKLETQNNTENKIKQDIPIDINSNNDIPIDINNSNNGNPFDTELKPLTVQNITDNTNLVQINDTVPSNSAINLNKKEDKDKNEEIKTNDSSSTKNKEKEKEKNTKTTKKENQENEENKDKKVKTNNENIKKQT